MSIAALAEQLRGGHTKARTLAEQLRGGHTKARTLAEQALTAADDIGASLNCFVTVDQDGALRAAEQADRELAAGVDRGPLHGIPVGVKDLVDTAGLRTTYGSRHFAGHVPTADADVVQALRQAGAVIVGKTHTHQFAYGPTGDVADTGPARNPLDTDRMTGGSSSGSAAAIAAGIVPAALGTDTGGSVRIPAALCGITGLRPTQGAVSSRGVFPLSATLDMVGPMAASVADTTVLWSALHGLSMLDTPVEDVRIGVVRPDQVMAGHQAAVERAVAGFGTREVPMPDLGTVYGQIQGPEAYAVHADRVREAPELYAPEVLERLTGAGQIPAWEYVSALRTRDRLRHGFFDRLGVDVLALPTVPIDAPPIGARDTDLGAGWDNPTLALLSCTVAWSVLGLPAISVPVPGGERPRAVQLVGRAGADDYLLAVAALVESRL
jgi:aspartyl-tRNA(Asn)/glutamyl-tRNA(Gln) amidotransferase subunit A